MPAFARASASSSPARDRRKPHDCGCGGKCGGCGSRKPRDHRAPSSASGRGHDFARVSVGVPRRDHQGKGYAECDPESGVVKKTVKENCAGDCVDRHEDVHIEHRTPCCQRYSRCWKSASNAAEKQACFDAYDVWMTQLSDWTECRAHTVEIACLEDFISLNCRDESSAPIIGLGVGGGVGTVAGGIAGGFLGPAIFSGLGSTAAGALGGVLGAVGGGLLGVLAGFGIGHIVKAVQQEDVGTSCCKHLQDTELDITRQETKKICGRNGQEAPCPFDAEGRILAAPPAKTATFNQVTAMGEA